MIELHVAATVDLTDVEKGLAAALAAGRSGLRPVLTELKKPMRADQLEHKKAKLGPEGGWAPRSAATLAANLHRKHARSLLGRLPTAVSYTTNANTLTGESRAKWSAIHQDGGTAGRGARIPARPFLWLSDKFLDLAGDLFAGAIARAFGGR